MPINPLKQEKVDYSDTAIHLSKKTKEKSWFDSVFDFLTRCFSCFATTNDSRCDDLKSRAVVVLTLTRAEEHGDVIKVESISSPEISMSDHELTALKSVLIKYKISKREFINILRHSKGDPFQFADASDKKWDQSTDKHFNIKDACFRHNIYKKSFKKISKELANYIFYRKKYGGLTKSVDFSQRAFSRGEHKAKATKETKTTSTISDVGPEPAINAPQAIADEDSKSVFHAFAEGLTKLDHRVLANSGERRGVKNSFASALSRVKAVAHKLKDRSKETKVGKLREKMLQRIEDETMESVGAKPAVGEKKVTSSVGILDEDAEVMLEDQMKDGPHWHKI